MAKAKRFFHNDNNLAFIYARYSSEAQRDCSIEQQIEEAKKYCKKKGYRYKNDFIYVDRAISGSRFDRPEFLRMLYEAGHIKPGYLVVWKSDRLSRDRFDAVFAKNRMRECGVWIEYVAEPMPEDEGSRIMMEALNEAMSQTYLINHAGNVSRGLYHNAEKCLYNGHKILGYIGKANEKYKTDPETAPIVKKIFEDYANGKSMNEIVAEINEAGFRTTRGKEFTEKSLWHILHNRTYLGEYKYGDILIQGGMPALVSEELFDYCQEMMAKNKHGQRGVKKKDNKPNDEDFWLTGHLYCGKCGCPMSGTSGTARNGERIYYYTCTGKKKKECNQKSVRKDKLEKAIIYILNDIIFDPASRIIIAEKVYSIYADQYGPDYEYEKALKTRIADIDKRLKNLLKDIEEGNSNEILRERMDELQKQKDLLNDEIKVEENRKKNEISPKMILRFLESYVGKFNDPILRMRVLPFIIDKVIVDDDKLAINIFFSGLRREESITDILDKIDAIERYNDSVKGGRLDISDEEFIRMALGNVPDIDKAKEQLMGPVKTDEGQDFFG